MLLIFLGQQKTTFVDHSEIHELSLQLLLVGKVSSVGDFLMGFIFDIVTLQAC